MGRVRRGRAVRGTQFFYSWEGEIDSRIEELKKEWKILSWKTPEEKDRDTELEIIRRVIKEQGGDPDTDLDTRELGHRSPLDMLPEDEIARFMAYQLVDKDAIKWKEMCETWDDFQIWELYGMRRTSLYIMLDDTEDDDGWE